MEQELGTEVGGLGVGNPSWVSQGNSCCLPQQQLRPNIPHTSSFQRLPTGQQSEKRGLRLLHPLAGRGPWLGGAPSCEGQVVCKAGAWALWGTMLSFH